MYLELGSINFTSSVNRKLHPTIVIKSFSSIISNSSSIPSFDE